MPLTTSKSQSVRTLLLLRSDEDALALTPILTGGLDGTDYQIDRARSLREAIRMLHDSQYDLMITDILLPDCDGLVLIQRLQEAASHIAIVVVSDTEDDELAFEAIRAGAQDFLVKGVVTHGQLRRSVRFSQERKRTEQRFMHLASRDPLTGLANRRATMVQLQSLVVRYRRLCRRFSVLYLDLDGFKGINDEYGHDVGDVLLKQVGQRLQSTMREYDLCARMGGDEFVIIVDTGEGITDLHQTPSRVVSTLAEPFNLGNHILQVTASVGVAVFPESGRTADALLKRADEQLYESKKAGKNQYTICEYAQEPFATRRPPPRSDKR
ncbi:MAG: diguanylate cyclase [Rhodobacterales bacterium]|nr:diguanylate cyclase [Rhodobacterales bacterium]